MADNYSKQIVFADRNNCKNVASLLQYLWIRDILVQTGMNLENCYPESDDPADQTIEQKANLRKAINNNDILIVDDRDNGIKIYVQNQRIAEWIKPSYILKQDLKQLEKSKQLYVEIIIQHWSVFDEQENIENDAEYNLD